MRQLELPIEKEEYDYNLYYIIGGCVYSTNDKRKMWKEIGSIPMGRCYEVRDRNGHCIDEFIPF